MVDGDKKPTMGYIYEAMDRLKEAIVASFSHDENLYNKAFEIIDQKWSAQFHKPLHAAGHYLNSEMFYDKAKEAAYEEVKSGLYACIRRLTPDIAIQDLIYEELDLYQNALKLFGDPMAIRHRKTKSLASRVVPLAVRGIGVFFNMDSTDLILLDDIDESNEWLMGKMDGEEGADEFVFKDDELTWADVDRADEASEPTYSTRAAVSTRKEHMFELFDEDDEMEMDIGLSQDNEVNEVLHIHDLVESKYA
nr:hypothetical protein CTI12_AA322260 [Tanacetum cinerariifolium]